MTGPSAGVLEQVAVEEPIACDDWNVLVGRVVGRWDHAALRVAPFSTAEGRFAEGARLCSVRGGSRRLLEVRAARRSGKTYILECGLSTDEAEALRGAELFIHPSMRPQLQEGEFYLDQLLGLSVRTELGDDLGLIEEVLETPAHDVYVTPEALIPGRPEFVVRIDWDQKQLIVRDIPGLRVATAS